MNWSILQGDAIEQMRTLPDACVQTCVTSPPYWSLRDYGVAGQIGLEGTPQAFVAKLVEVFAEVWRVLRDDGTLWVNMGDSYCGSPAGKHSNNEYVTGGKGDGAFARLTARMQTGDGVGPANCIKDFGGNIKPKDLVGVPWTLAFALRDAGWYLRSDIPWVKRSPMPESVTDRPSKALEYVFLLSKKPTYYFDMDAVRRESVSDHGASAPAGTKGEAARQASITRTHIAGSCDSGESRNFRSADLWFDSIDTPHGLCGLDDELVGLDVTSAAFKGSHFAVFPPKLVEPLIKAGSSEKGCCPNCLAPWRRIVEKKREATRPGENTKVAAARDKLPAEEPGRDRGAARFERTTLGSVVGNRDPERHCTTSQTIGWKQTCKCPAHEPIPCTVLDCFGGAMTTGLVALRLGRRFIGIELSESYCQMGRKRLIADAPLFNGMPTEADPS